MFRKLFGKSGKQITQTAKAPSPVDVVQAWAVQNATDMEAETPAAKWARLRAEYPQTYNALELIADTRPDMIVTASEQYYSGMGKVWEFKLSLPGFETRELIDAKYNANERVFYPIRVEYSLEQKRVFGAGTSGGGLTDETAATAVLKTAKDDGYIAVTTMAGLDGRDRPMIVAGPTGVAQPRKGLSLVPKADI